MPKIQNSKELGNKIRELRLKNAGKFSQEEIAKILGVNRVVLTNIENGERNIKDDEIEMLAEIFEVPKSYFIDEQKEDFKELSKEDPYYNFKRILLYVLQKCGDKPNVGRIVLYKLLYFIEFNHFEKYGDSLLGIDFIKWPMGPVPKDAKQIFQQMEEDNQIVSYIDSFRGYEQHKIAPRIEADLGDLEYSKIQIIEDVISRLSNMTAREISEYSHGDIPYKATKEIGEVISKGKVFYRTPEYSIAV